MMWKQALAVVLALSLTACASNVGSITFNKAGRSWATAFWDELIPYCSGDDVPVGVRLEARMLRADALFAKVAVPAYSFKYGPQVDAIGAALDEARASIAAGADPFTAERRFNKAQLLVVDGFLEIIDNEHSTLLDIPNPVSAAREARAKAIPFAVEGISISADVAEFCNAQGYPLTGDGNA